MAVVLIVLSVIVLLIPWYIYQKKKAAARVLALQQLATAWGWTFTASPPLSVIPNPERHFLFSQGRSKTIINMLSGEMQGVRAALFDYKYITGHGRSTQIHHQTVAYFQSAKLQLPEFSLRPEGFLYKLITALGYKDIDFPSHPIFSGKYLLRGPDEPAIRQAFNEGVLAYFDNHLNLWVDGAGQELFVYYMNASVPPENFQLFLAQAEAVLNVFQRPALATVGLSSYGR